jgi:hypothetical protein
MTIKTVRSPTPLKPLKRRRAKALKRMRRRIDRLLTKEIARKSNEPRRTNMIDSAKAEIEDSIRKLLTIA